MAFFNSNYSAKHLPVGSYAIGDLGNGITASTVHQIFCLADGDITITPLGGGDSFTWSATAGQSMNILVGACNVASGEFVGFKPQYAPSNQPPYYR